MPPTTINPEAAVVSHANQACDTEFGIQYAMDGILLKSLAYKPTRQAKEKYDHLDNDAVEIHTRPRYEIDVEADVTAIAGGLVLHPGAGIDRSVVTNFYPAVAFGFPARGYFRYAAPEMTAVPGDLYALKFGLRLMYKPNATFQRIAA
jgi:hypothetical protein